MKRLVIAAAFVISSVIITSCGNTNAASKVKKENVIEATKRDNDISKGAPIVAFDRLVHDFGTVDEGEVINTSFVVTNSGKSNLVITDAKSTCGCTVPVWPKEPIAPGQSNVIKVKYDTKRIGAFNKSITISSNAATAPTKVIRIKGKTLAVAEETSPVKTPAGSSPTAE